RPEIRCAFYILREKSVRTYLYNLAGAHRMEEIFVIHRIPVRGGGNIELIDWPERLVIYKRMGRAYGRRRIFFYCMIAQRMEFHKLKPVVFCTVYVEFVHHIIEINIRRDFRYYVIEIAFKINKVFRL